MADEIEDVEVDEVEDAADEADEAEDAADEADADAHDEAMAEDIDTDDVEQYREAIRKMAAQIETYRNRLAELGVEDPIEDEAAEVIDEVEADTDEVDEDDAVAAFEADYARRRAELDKITGGN